MCCWWLAEARRVCTSCGEFSDEARYTYSWCGWVEGVVVFYVSECSLSNGFPICCLLCFWLYVVLLRVLMSFVSSVFPVNILPYFWFSRCGFVSVSEFNLSNGLSIRALRCVVALCVSEFHLSNGFTIRALRCVVVLRMSENSVFPTGSQ